MVFEENGLDLCPLTERNKSIITMSTKNIDIAIFFLEIAFRLQRSITKEITGLNPKSIATRIEGSVHFRPIKRPTQAPNVDIFKYKINFQALPMRLILTGDKNNEITVKPSHVRVKVQNNNVNKSMCCSKPDKSTSTAALRTQYPRMYTEPGNGILLFINIK